MRAVVFDGKLRFRTKHRLPRIRPGWARIGVRLAGICRTDLEITRGYMGFSGVPGHEFVGTVDKCADTEWIGRRVVGEINAACGVCQWCRADLGRHCPHRVILGLSGLDGCLADYCVLPMANLFEVPAAIPDDRAVFTEPLSAACEILEQLSLKGSERVVVLGDGRLGILSAWVLSTVLSDVTLVGHHRAKLRTAKWRHLKTARGLDEVSPGADLVVDATGSPSGLAEAISLCRPRGTIVLKSTIAEEQRVALALLVISEQTVIGSRCGRFEDGLRMLSLFPDMPIERLITARYPMEQATAAFERAGQPDALKVLIEV